MKTPPHYGAALVESDKRRDAALVVDDTKLMVELLKKCLQSDGYRVYEASNGPEAEQVFLEHPDINLVVCDINLGSGDNGFDVLSHLIPKKSERFFKFCFVTASNNDELRETAKKMGADEFVCKPINPQKFRETVAILMGSAESGRLHHDDVKIKLDSIHGEVVDTPMKPYIKLIELTRFTILLEASGFIEKGYSFKVYSPRLARLLSGDTPFFTLKVENSMTVQAAKKKAEAMGKKLAYDQCQNSNSLVRCNVVDLTSSTVTGIENLHNEIMEKKRVNSIV